MDNLVQEVETKKNSKIVLIIIVSIVGLLIIASIVAYSILSANSKPESVLSKFQAAVKSGNAAAAHKILVSNDPVLELTEGDVTKLLTYLDKKTSVLDDEIEGLKNQINNEEEQQLKYDYYSMLTLVKEEGLLGLFDTYKIAVQPYYFTLYTNQKGVVIKLDGKDILTSKSDDYTKVIGPLMPGSYKVDAQFDSEYVSLNTEKQVMLPEDHNHDIDLSIDAQYVYLESNHSEAKLYLNGKDTKLTVGDAYRFGPIASNGTMTVQANLDNKWGSLTSESVIIDGSSSYINLEILGYTIYPTASVLGAEVLIDGQSTGIKFEQAMTDGIGPIPYDKEVTVTGQYEFPWGKYKTNEIVFDKDSLFYDSDYDYSSYAFFTEISEDIRSNIVKQLDGFIPSAFDSVTDYDAALLENVSEANRSVILDSLYYELYDYAYDGFYPTDATYTFDTLWVTSSEKDKYYITLSALVNFKYSTYDYLIDSYSDTAEQLIADIILLYDAADGSLVVESFQPYVAYYDYYEDDYTYNDVEFKQFAQ
ncbi:TcaA 3rd/4th domain-containing protein [Paenibacillus endoradicis]|uniref:TcaA 3rd/4th domain-containing protein n=1 Tax=Paenibacillus endoradicis TaxID=2972487 RepID=UPI002158DEFD|nr:hypothetical protein [Paenibacillus endoradicis]MCR8657089.1 hypothetical protein [Paenibacillus endoradicis]